MNEYLLIAYIVWNMAVFCLYGVDKQKAKHGAWRIPESTLLVCAFLFGAVGAYFGMKKFRHKTKHTKFKVLIPLFMVLNLVLILVPKETYRLLSKLF